MSSMGVQHGCTVLQVTQTSCQKTSFCHSVALLPVTTRSVTCIAYPLYINHNYVKRIWRLDSLIRMRGSQSNGRATQLISSHLMSVVDGWVFLIRMSPTKSNAPLVVASTSSRDPGVVSLVPRHWCRGKRACTVQSCTFVHVYTWHCTTV